MQQRTFNIAVSGYKGTVDRISKTKARKLYDSGETVFLLGCNLWIGPMFQPYPAKYREYEARSFDQMVSDFTYYNCDYECGYYPAFYQLRTKSSYVSKAEPCKLRRP